MRLLVTGALGMLGQDVVSAARGAGHEVTACSRAELDITDVDALHEAIAGVRPDVVINCAAWTDVDGAEAAESAAFAVNGAGPGQLGEAAAEHGAWTVHVSTDYVFDGRARSPYVESSATGPLSAYGRSKLTGERQLAAAAPGAHTIVRSSWLFGTGGIGFPAKIRGLAAARKEVTVVDDQVGCPTFAAHLAAALLTIAAARPLGIVHVAGAGHCSWYEFAREIASAWNLPAQIKPGRSADLARPAPRPAFSVLGTERDADAPRLPHWRDGLAEYLGAAVTAA
jgi:dTDP-4-dehydrorhamnose reductase